MACVKDAGFKFIAAMQHLMEKRNLFTTDSNCVQVRDAIPTSLDEVTVTATEVGNVRLPVYLGGPEFQTNLQIFLRKMTNIVQMFSTCWQVDLASTDLKEYKSLFTEYVDSLATNLTVECEIPVQDLVTYVKCNPEGNVGAVIEKLTNMPNLWVSLDNTDAKFSLSCAKHRILILITALKYQGLKAEIPVELELALNRFRESRWTKLNGLSITTKNYLDVYFLQWFSQNKQVQEIGRLYVENSLRHFNPTDSADNKVYQYEEKLIEYFGLSLVSDCGVPVKYLYRGASSNPTQTVEYAVSEEFKRITKKDPSVFEYYKDSPSYSLSCFHKSVTDMLIALGKISNNECKPIYDVYHAEVTRRVGMSSLMDILMVDHYFQDLNQFNGIATWAFDQFISCMRNKNFINTQEQKIDLLKILSRFQNHYMFCGATPSTTKIDWISVYNYQRLNALVKEIQAGAQYQQPRSSL